MINIAVACNEIQRERDMGRDRNQQFGLYLTNVVECQTVCLLFDFIIFALCWQISNASWNCFLHNIHGDMNLFIAHFSSHYVRELVKGHCETTINCSFVDEFHVIALIRKAIVLLYFRNGRKTCVANSENVQGFEFIAKR